mmetsp:Transcript_33123/g.44150  ORF Transcript_33123/g.44150 Transcript_33123/m.44150 type:complete len:280 (-) Transcript_33123:109-948(-)
MVDLNTKPNYCQRFHFELSIPFYELKEGYYGTLDMQKNFALGIGLKTFAAVAKFVFLALAIAALVINIVEYRYGIFLLAFLTRWTVIVQIIYLSLSFLGTVLPNENKIITKLTWVLFSLSADIGLVVVLIFWLAVWDGGLRYTNTMEHGGIFGCILIDGLILNRTPVRIKHVTVGWIYAFFYLIWSVLQNTVFRYNPEPDEDDDAIYDVMKWRVEPLRATITFAVQTFGLLPLIHLGLWALSLPGRHYTREAEDLEIRNEKESYFEPNPSFELAPAVVE